MSRIGIIMATYNGEKYLREQIESILSNTYTDWHLTICDDGSTDATDSIINEYVMKYPDKITGHKNQKNLGVMYNFLQGVLDNTADYYMFCDQDDVWLKDKIKITYEKMLDMEKQWGSDIPISIFTDATLVDQDLNVLHSSFFKTSNLDVRKIDLPHILMENKLLGCTVMCNNKTKEMLDKLPDTMRMHDWWIGILTASFGKIGYVPTQTILYRQHSHNVVGGQGKKEYIKNRIHSLNKQKEVLRLTEKQAECFYEIYKNRLSKENGKIIYNFSRLNQMNWLKKRIVVIKYGFLKTGLLRNIGVLLLI